MTKNGILKINFCNPAKWGFTITEQFEKEFASKIGVKHFVAVNSGYSALFLTFKALGIKEGDEVIIPDFTMYACPMAVKECGAKPVMVDVSLNGNINVKEVEKAITKKTKAILAVHIYGHPAEISSLVKIARKHKLHLIEDCAEAHGAEYRGKQVGSFGIAGCYSFYNNKIISTGEGGGIATNSSKLAKKIQKLRSYSFTKGYYHDDVGYGFRMNPYGSSEGLKMLKEWDKHIESRRQIAQFYNKHIRHGIKPAEVDCKNVYWMYTLLVKDKPKLQKYLASKGIETRDFFRPITEQPIFKNKVGRVSHLLSKNGIILPSMPELKKKELKYIADAINSFYE